MATLYHITDKTNIPSILAHGLKPKVGANSALCYEPTRFIYLTDEKSIPYWRILLGIENPVVLAIQIDETPECVEYNVYNEYCVDTDIPADQISIANDIDLKATDTRAMRYLCYDQMIALSNICQTIVTCYKRHESLKPFVDDIIRETAICKRMDFACYTQAEWAEFLKSYGEEGAYTFCDKYDIYGVKSKPPLWQKITMYKPDEFTDIRNEVSRLIQTSFPDCLWLNTGGWTG